MLFSCRILLLTEKSRYGFNSVSAFLYCHGLSIFLTSTAFVSTNAKYGITLSRYAVFLQNCPLGYDPKEAVLFYGIT